MSKLNTTIRRYALVDIPWIVRTCAREIPTLPNYGGVEVDKDYVTNWMQKACFTPNDFLCNLLINESGEKVGVVGCYITQAMIAPVKFSSDYFLFVMPEYRCLNNVTKLIRSYVEWAETNGVKPPMIRSTVSGGLRDSAMNVLLQREGFKAIGTIYSYEGRTK